MTRVIFASVAALASLTFDPSQAVGIEAPWCAVTRLLAGLTVRPSYLGNCEGRSSVS